MKKVLCVFCANKKGIEPEYEAPTSIIPVRDYTCPECNISFMQISLETIETSGCTDMLERIKKAREIPKDKVLEERLPYKIFIPATTGV